MNENQNKVQKLLLKNILESEKFKSRFYESPSEAAAELGIKLTAEEKESLEKDIEQIKNNVDAYDKVRQFYEIGAPTQPGFISILPGLV